MTTDVPNLKNHTSFSHDGFKAATNFVDFLEPCVYDFIAHIDRFSCVSKSEQAEKRKSVRNGCEMRKMAT